MKPLLSIVVPTKNRYNCLKILIELFLKVHTSKDIELVISDNSDDNSEILEFLKEKNDGRIVYVYTKESISVVENSDKAILNSSGEYVNMIGDDDGNQREIIDVVRFMKTEGIESLNCKRCQYRWPGFKSAYFNSSASILLEKFNGKIEKINLPKEFNSVISKGACVSYQKLPCVYNGIIRRDILDNIYNRTGTFFPGPSPDMSNAIALSQIVKNHVWLDYPISWAGKNSNSAAGLGALHKHSNHIENVPWLPKDAAQKWDSRLPKYWTVATVWAESAIKALESMGNDKLSSEFNVSYVYGCYLAYSYNDRDYLKPFLENASIFQIFKGVINTILSRGNAFLQNMMLAKYDKSVSFIKIKNIESIIDCEEYIHNHYPFKILK